MSIIAKLHVGGKEFTILQFRYGITQNADYNGYPSAKPIGGHWSIVLESTKDAVFYEWMIAENTLKNVEIVLSSSSFNTKTRTIKLYDVYCVKYHENFDGVNNQPMQTFIELSPAIMMDSGVKIFEKYWKVSNLFDNNAAPTVIREEEPEIVDCYYTDLDGNEQAESVAGDEVYLVLQTENAIGKTIDIDLSNHSKDFIYNDAIIENDILKDFSVTSDLHKIKLRVIAQQEGEIEKIQK